MSERPIIFSSPMVRAILEGRKTQMRRIIKPTPIWIADPSVPFKTSDANPKGIIKCPYGKIGDTLWVRESYREAACSGYMPDTKDARYTVTCEYKATFYNPIGMDRGGRTFTLPEMHYGGGLRKDGGVKWKPSIHMPRWAARLFLRVVGVRVERVRDISSEDAYEEGARCSCLAPVADCKGNIIAFAKLWDSINSKRGSWWSNPYVWVIIFERGEQT